MENKRNSKAKNNKQKKFTFNGWFNNNKVLFVVSLLIACGLWVVFSQNSTEETTTTISDIPIVVDLPDQAKDEGYKIYSGIDKTASVIIRGNRITVGSITKDDIQVVAQDTSSINSSNNYPLTLVAKKSGVKSDYEIVSVLPNVINYYVDKERAKEFTIENQFDTTNVKIPADYYLGKPSLSTEKVTITGPEAEVKKIEKVAIVDSIEGEQSSTITKSEKVVLLDSDGEEINNEYLSVEPSTVDTTIQILPEKKVDIKASYTNVPSGLDPTSIVTITPETVTIAGPLDTLNKVSGIDIGTIDFCTLLPTTTQGKFNINTPEKCMNIGNQTQATVNFDLSGFATTSINVTAFSTAGLQSGYKATVTTTGLDVTVVGPADIIDSITSDNIVATADLSSVGTYFTGSVEVPVKLSIKGVDQSWVYKGTTDSTVNVYITKS